MAATMVGGKRTLMRWIGRTAVLQGLLASLAVGPGAMGAVAPAPQPEGQAGPTPVVLIEHAGLSSLLVADKDAGLREAMAMLPARVRELPNEIDDLEEIPAPMLNAVLTMLTKPGRMGVTMDGANQANGAMGLGLVMSAGPMERAETAELDGVVRELAREGLRGQAIEPSTKFEGMSEVALPPGPVRFGPRQGADGWRYEVHFASSPDPDAAFASLPAYGLGMTPVMRASMDLEPITPLIQNLMGFAGAMAPGAGLGMMRLADSGLIGENSVKYSMTYGYTPDRSVMRTVASGMKPFAGANMLSTEALTPSMFRLIPSDASVAALARVDLRSTVGMLRELAQQNPDASRGLDEFRQQTGVDIFEDVLGSLGSAFGFYMADSAGGAGMLSLVAFVQVSDREKFGGANERLRSVFNGIAGQESEGHVRGHAWRDGDSELFTLGFPGVPVPLELTYALEGEWMVLALSPQGALSAVRQMRGQGDAGLMANRAFAEAMPQGKAMTSISFVDTRKTMARGYQYTTLLGSAVRNLVQSPVDPERMPGLVVPAFGDLAKGVRAQVQYGFWDGDDYVTMTEADRSVLVNFAGVMGVVDPFMPLITLGVAGMAAQQQSRPRYYDDDEPDW